MSNTKYEQLNLFEEEQFQPGPRSKPKKGDKDNG